MARAKKNFKNQNQELRLFTPESINDLQEIGELLQTYESSIIINLSKSKSKQDVIKKAISYIEGFTTSYMRIKSKKVFTKVYVLTSTRNIIM